MYFVAFFIHKITLAFESFQTLAFAFESSQTLAFAFELFKIFASKCNHIWVHLHLNHFKNLHLNALTRI